MTPELHDSCKRAVHVKTIDGQILHAGQAALFILSQTGFPIIGKIAAYRPFIWFVEMGYWLIARYRGKLYKWFLKNR